MGVKPGTTESLTQKSKIITFGKEKPGDDIPIDCSSSLVKIESSMRDN